MNIVFKASPNIQQKMIKYYADKRKEKTPPYAVFQAMDADTIITLYESGKVMFQGISADIDANLWIEMEKKLNNKIIDINSKDKKDKSKKDNNEPKVFFNESTVGSDGVGTGDYFGPIVVTASYVSKDNISFLSDLGVKDSKKITDDLIMKIAPEIIKKIPYVTLVLDNEKYNNSYSEELNMNKIKAILHNKAIVSLLKKDNYDYSKIVIDQFVYPKKYFEHIYNAKEKVTKITFITKAEDKCLSVAASSIISRYTFLLKMKELESEVKMDIPKGAGTIVDEAGVAIAKKYGLKKLESIAKLNFKNTDKIKKALNI
jgi:ribonuclease HIII